MTYTVHKIELNGTLSNKEHLNNIDEVNAWLVMAADKSFNNIQIVRDNDNKTRFLTRSQNNMWVK